MKNIGIVLQIIGVAAFWSAAAPAADTNAVAMSPAQCLADARRANLPALKRAVQDLMASHPRQYRRGAGYLKRIAACEARLTNGQTVAKTPELAGEIARVQREALMDNPLLDFDRLLLVKRKGALGLPQNWQGNCSLPRSGYDNEIAVLSPLAPPGTLGTLYKPAAPDMVADVDLNFDADRMLFSMIGTNRRWQVWEIGADGAGLRQVTPGEEPDVDNYDACYLPNGRILFCSTRCFAGVPCVGGADSVANLFLMDADGGHVRQVTFDQDHDWCPAVLNDGRVIYSRWEYSDLPHYFSRLLYRMNPDGTEQFEFYGSNSYWPNSFFYARAIPRQATKVVAVVSGHHGVPRMGELVILDPARGRQEADGAVQRIPGFGKPVSAVTADTLVDGAWPKFLHPYPLSDKYFIVACQPSAGEAWGIYLVDVFDNMLLLREEPGCALLEPIPLKRQRRPPVVAERVKPDSRDATVYLSDVYAGEGLKGVPRGTVKRLRVYEIHYAYPQMGGHINIGIDGPWDVHRIVGTVPVNPDGSAAFKVPANTPLAVQPLDEEGKALQVMRSWFTAMPGESLSCVGCHEQQNSAPPSKATAASRQAPSEITPWYGPPRGFSFKREVQPVLDHYCAGCHDGSARPDGRAIPDFARTGAGWKNFTLSYIALHPFVRRPGPESDYHVQKPLEFHADTSELIQMLENGHHNVKLDAEAWDRLVTWIDLNVPDHGTWGEHRGIAGQFHQRRLEMRTKYANRPEDPEAIPVTYTQTVAFVKPPAEPERKPPPALDGWPFDAAKATNAQHAAGAVVEQEVDLGGGLKLPLVLIPAGQFVMGDPAGAPDEGPAGAVKIGKCFYMGKFEISNEQYARFDARHDSAVISMTNKDQNRRGIPVNAPRQPVVRVTWEEAMAFCEWLSKQTGRRCTLPTEAQWEWACRAGAATAFSYGGMDVDFSGFANLADSALGGLALGDSPKWHPRDERFNDRAMVSAQVGSYQPNAWGLCDMHGNAGEWTRTAYRPYPYDAGDGRESPSASDKRVARGGSWYDRPYRATASYRRGYRPYQAVFDVGFRVVCEDAPPERP